MEIEFYPITTAFLGSTNTFAQRKTLVQSIIQSLTMHYSSFAQDAIIAAVAALALAPTAAAHGHVDSISVNGKTYPGAVPVCDDGCLYWKSASTDFYYRTGSTSQPTRFQQLPAGSP
jgi:hypothetical protein